MQQGYEAVARDIQKLEQYLLQHDPGLLYYTPLIRRQNLDHYKLATQATRRAQGQKKWLLLLQAVLLLPAMWFSSILRNQADFFLLEHGSKRRAQVDGKLFNRLADALTFFLRDHGKVALAEIIEHTGQWQKNRWQPAINLFPVIMGVNIRLRLRQWLKGESAHQEAVNNLKRTIEEQGLELVYLHPTLLISDLARIDLFKEYFLKILRRIQAKQVFSFCYYSKEAFGLTLAAKELGLQVIEVQHGSQGAAHPMYAAYCGLEHGHHQLLPNLFWVWSNTEKTYFQGWTQQATDIKVVRGGNPWLSFAKKDLRKNVEADSKADQRVLLSLQEPQYFHDSFLAELISSHTEGVQWLLRVHPLYAELEADLLTLFGEQSNVHIRGVAQQNLYEQFSSVDLHITGFSTTCLEALEFQVPTIIIHPNGKAYFESHLAAGYFKFASNAQDCWELITNPTFVVAPKEILQGDETDIKRTIAYLEEQAK